MSNTISCILKLYEWMRGGGVGGAFKNTWLWKHTQESGQKISRRLVQDEFSQFHAEDNLLLTVQVHSFACV
jgi:hypothetical protein